MVKVVCGKSRIGEESYRGEGMEQIVVGEIELGGSVMDPFIGQCLYAINLIH